MVGDLYVNVIEDLQMLMAIYKCRWWFINVVIYKC